MSGLKSFHGIHITRHTHVSPYIGEWIEICGCVKKNKENARVSPYIGEWIEIRALNISPLDILVSPYIGEWIEIDTPPEKPMTGQRLTLHR